MAEFSLKQWTDKKSWEEFLQKQKSQANFLQSWHWGEFLSEKNEIYRLGLLNEKNELVLIVQLSRENIKFTKKFYLYAAYGPVFNESLKPSEKAKALDYLKDNIQKTINDNNLAYLLFENNLEENPENQKIFKSWQKEKSCLQPSDTLIIPIADSEEDILARMHSKTRYNIRLAEKKNIEIIWDDAGQYFEEWFSIMKETAARNKIRLLPKNHYKEQVRKKYLKLILAKFENKIIAGNLVSLYPPTAVYVHGASKNEDRKLMAPYLLQWASIKAAKEAGCEYFDFWGINVDNKHPNWAGITRFKQGFNPEQKANSYLAAYSHKYQSFYYYLDKFLSALRQIKKFVLTR